MKKVLTVLIMVSCVTFCYTNDQYQTVLHGCGKNQIQERVKKYYIEYNKIIIEEDQMLVPVEDQLFSITKLYKDEKGFYVLKKDIDITVQIKDYKVYSCRDCNMKFRSENSFYRHKTERECSAQIRRDRERRKERKERREECGRRSEFSIPHHRIPNHNISVPPISVPR